MATDGGGHPTGAEQIRARRAARRGRRRPSVRCDRPDRQTRGRAQGPQAGARRGPRADRALRAGGAPLDGARTPAPGQGPPGREGGRHDLLRDGEAARPLPAGRAHRRRRGPPRRGVGAAGRRRGRRRALGAARRGLRAPRRQAGQRAVVGGARRGADRPRLRRRRRGDRRRRDDGRHGALHLARAGARPGQARRARRHLLARRDALPPHDRLAAVRGQDVGGGAGQAGAGVAVGRAHPRARPVAAAALLPREDDGEGARDALPEPAAAAAGGAGVPRPAALPAGARGAAAARTSAARRPPQELDVRAPRAPPPARRAGGRTSA